MTDKNRGKKTPLAVSGEKYEDLQFQPSPSTSIGIELELQIIDRETGDLAPGAMRLLQACEEEDVTGVSAELLQSMVEIKSSVCSDVRQLEDELSQRLGQVHHIANSLGFDLAMAGTHPFNRPETNAVYPAKRYQWVHHRMAWLTSQTVVFGLHIHVGLPSGDMAIAVINKLVEYLPHLLALSASSPFWRGVDTGMASTRTSLFRLSPHASLPHYFSNWKEFVQYVGVMRSCRAIRNTKDIYWDIRPRPSLGTIEFRVCDMPPTLRDALALAALIRSLVLGAIRTLEQQKRKPRGGLQRNWIAVENKWLAARFGLEAQCIRTPQSKLRSLADDVERLLEMLRPIIKGRCEKNYLEYLQPVNDFETGAGRQRRLHRETGEWQVVIDDIKGRWFQQLETMRKSQKTPERANE